MALPVVQSRNDWIVTMEKRLRGMFTLGFKAAVSYKELWQVEGSDGYREEIAEYIKPDTLKKTPEGSPFPNLNMGMLRSTVVIHDEWEGMMTITRQMRRDAKYRQMFDDAYGLGDAANRTMYEQGILPYLNGFTTATSSDGNPWFYNQHPLHEDPTQYDDNLMTGRLSPENLESALIKLWETKDEWGKIREIGEGEVQLIVSARDRILAAQLEDKDAYLPGSNDFNRNKFKVKAYVVPKLAANNSAPWFVRDKTEAMNTHFIREGPDFYLEMDIPTRNVLQQASASFSFGIFSHRGTVGSAG